MTSFSKLLCLVVAIQFGVIFYLVYPNESNAPKYNHSADNEEKVYLSTQQEYSNAKEKHLKDNINNLENHNAALSSTPSTNKALTTNNEQPGAAISQIPGNGEHKENAAELETLIDRAALSGVWHEDDVRKLFELRSRLSSDDLQKLRRHYMESFFIPALAQGAEPSDLPVF